MGGAVMTASNGDADVMTSRERQELAALVRRREKVAKADAKHRAGELIAAAEEMLSTQFSIQDELWEGIAVEAARMVAEVDAQLAAKCREAGIPEQLRPAIGTSWYSRGVNAYGPRRAELRNAARTRIEAQLRRALADIERRSVEVQTDLVAGGLTSDAARAFIAAMPTVEQLLPPLTVEDVRRALPDGEHDYQDPKSIPYALAHGWTPRAVVEEAGK
jgi:hypothetical protein